MSSLMRAGLVVAAVGLPGCMAPGHDQVPALPIDPAVFEGANCRQLDLMLRKTTRTLVFVGMAQDHLRAEDDTRTFGAPTPMGSFYEPSRVAQLARLKGESVALRAQLERMNCVAFPNSMPVAADRPS